VKISSVGISNQHLPQNSVKLYIKYMVSIRCKMVVREVLKKLGLHYSIVELGEVNVMETITEEQREQIRAELHKSGLELMDDRKSILIERIKNLIVEMVHYTDELPKVNFSAFLSEKLNHDYTYMANLFSETEGITIEHYILLHKIERVKELILYDELNLSEIAWKMHYSSVAHLSSQFKKITGLTPSYFKSLKHKRRSTLDNV
jgi:AraC-like DNA-binding protein